MILLKAQPSLLSKIIPGITASWISVTNYGNICALSHLAFLLNNTEIDMHLKTQLRAALSNRDSDNSLQLLSQKVVASLLPSGVVHNLSLILRQHQFLSITFP